MLKKMKLHHDQTSQKNDQTLVPFAHTAFWDIGGRQNGKTMRPMSLRIEQYGKETLMMDAIKFSRPMIVKAQQVFSNDHMIWG